MRRVLDETIYIHGNYTFETRAQMYAAIANAKRLCVDDGVRAPLEITCNVLGDRMLLVIVKVPMFEAHEYTASLFNILRGSARKSAVEARVDVM
jgi:hypothetical protein